MKDLKNQEMAQTACELDPRGQNLLAAFRQQFPQADLQPVRTYLLSLMIAHRLLAQEQELFDRYQLSEGKLSVLLLLRNAPEQRLSPSELADSSRVSRGTMTGLLAGLERDGFVVREADPADGRRCTMRMTDRSEEVIEKLLADRLERIQSLLGGLSPDELADQESFLEKVDARMGE